MTDRKTKFFFYALIILTAFSIIMTYYKYIILKDYDIHIDQNIFTNDINN